MAALEERVSYLEGTHEHLATKADVAAVRIEIAAVKTDIAKMDYRFDGRFDCRSQYVGTIYPVIQRLIG